MSVRVAGFNDCGGARGATVLIPGGHHFRTICVEIGPNSEVKNHTARWRVLMTSARYFGTTTQTSESHEQLPPTPSRARRRASNQLSAAGYLQPRCCRRRLTRHVSAVKRGGNVLSPVDS